MVSPELDQALAEDIGRFYADPLGFVLYAFPWDSDPTLQIVKLPEPWSFAYACEYGPDAWACELLLPMGGLISVDWVKYIDTSGTLQTLATDQYMPDPAHEPGRILRAYGATWPSVRSQHNAVQVQYITGYGTTAVSVPAPIRHWIKLGLTFLYEQRSHSGVGAKEVSEFRFADALLDPYYIYGT